MNRASPDHAWCSKCLDFHAHFMHPEVYAEIASFNPSTGFGARPLPPDSPVFRQLYEPTRQILDMDARGIDMHVISSCDVITSRSAAEPKDDERMSVLVNDMAADWVARHPSRFIGTCVIPLGDMDRAMRELSRSVAMDLRIVNLPSNYRGVYLGDPRYEELWAEIHRLGLIAFIHPDGVRDPWFQDHAMWNSIGQSIEEVKVMSTLIYEGVMDRHRGLKIVMAHGGGYMPHYMGRLDRNFTDKPYTAKNLSKLPSAYLRDFYYDSCVYDARTLELLVERVGANRVVMGGDYPVASQNPRDLLKQATGLTDEERAAIVGGTAAGLLGLARSSDADAANGPPGDAG